MSLRSLNSEPKSPLERVLAFSGGGCQSLSVARKQIPVNHSALRGMRMPLIDPLPKPLEEKLAPVIESKDVAAAVFTDLNPSGRFGEEWLVLTPTRLSVYASDGNGFAPRVELNLEEI